MWICTVVGIIIGIILAPATLVLWDFMGYSLYDRSGLDGLAESKLGNYTWKNIIVDDLLITSYEYNSK